MVSGDITNSLTIKLRNAFSRAFILCLSLDGVAMLLAEAVVSEQRAAEHEDGACKKGSTGEDNRSAGTRKIPEKVGHQWRSDYGGKTDQAS